MRVEYPEIVQISCYGMFTSKLCAGSEILTSDTWIVKSAKEDDVVLPQRHSRYNLFKKGGYNNEGEGNRTCVLSAPMGELWSLSDPICVS
jgi:hypothetical protein